MCAENQPSLFIVNLRKPMPLGKKLRLLKQNIWVRVSRHATCCGHPGEPGC